MNSFLCWAFGHRLVYIRKVFGGWGLHRCVKCEKLVTIHAGSGIAWDYDEDVVYMERLVKEDQDERDELLR